MWTEVRFGAEFVQYLEANDEDYAQIGSYLRKSAEEYAEAWKAGR